MKSKLVLDFKNSAFKACHAGGRGFESRPPASMQSPYKSLIYKGFLLSVFLIFTPLQERLLQLDGEKGFFVSRPYRHRAAQN